MERRETCAKRGKNRKRDQAWEPYTWGQARENAKCVPSVSLSSRIRTMSFIKFSYKLTTNLQPLFIHSLLNPQFGEAHKKALEIISIVGCTVINSWLFSLQ